MQVKTERDIKRQQIGKEKAKDKRVTKKKIAAKVAAKAVIAIGEKAIKNKK